MLTGETVRVSKPINYPNAINTNSSNSIVARGGRPRKYEKGKEPYLEARRRAAAKLDDVILPTGVKFGCDLSAVDYTDEALPEASFENGEKRKIDSPEDEIILNAEEAPLPKRRGRPPKKQKIDDGGEETGPKRGRPKGTATPNKYVKRSQVAKNTEKNTAPDGQSKDQVNSADSSIVEVMSTKAPKKRKPPAKEVTPIRKSKRTKGTVPKADGNGVVISEIVSGPSTDTSAEHGQTRVISSDQQGNICIEEAASLQGSEKDIKMTPFLEESSDTVMPAGVQDGGSASEDIGDPGGNSPTEDLPIPTAPVHVINGVVVEVESLDVEGNESYGSIGGMLALARQQVVMDLIAEHGGVFPGGNELRFAFDKRFRKKNPKSGLCDRRLIRGIVQSLQYKKKIHPLTFSFTNSNGSLITKKILVDASLGLDSPLVNAMVKEMISVEGNLWFPPNTELQQNIQERFAKPPHWSLPKPREVEGVEFDRIHPNSVMQLKMKRAAKAADRAAAKAAKLATPSKPRGRPRIYTENHTMSSGRRKKFTDEQKEEAARRRRAELRAEKVLLKLNQQYRHETFDPYDPPPTEENLPRRVWWNDFVDRDLTEPRDGKRFLQELHDVEKWEKNMENSPMAEREDNGLIMINHFAPDTEVGDNFEQVPVLDMDQRIRAPDFSEPRPDGPRKPGPKPGSTRRKPGAKTGPKITRTVDLLMGDTPKRKRRAPGSFEKAPSRRERAMTAIRKNTLKASDTLPLQEREYIGKLSYQPMLGLTFMKFLLAGSSFGTSTSYLKRMKIHYLSLLSSLGLSLEVGIARSTGVLSRRPSLSIMR